MTQKILLHLCCGPCGTASIKKIKEDDYRPTLYYYNPNIHPKNEYQKRFFEVGKLAQKNNLELIEGLYNPNEYFEKIKGLEEDKNQRCLLCWELRLKEAARKAKELEFSNFGTSLRISPYQNQDKLLEIARKIAKEFNLNFYDYPLTEFYRDSIDLSKKMEMYRQKYCGCIFSKDYK